MSTNTATEHHPVDCHVCGAEAVISIHRSHYVGGGDENFLPHYNEVGEKCQPLLIPYWIKRRLGVFVSQEEQERLNVAESGSPGYHPCPHCGH